MSFVRVAVAAVFGLAVVIPAAGAREGGKPSKRHFELRWMPSDTASTEPVDLTGLGAVRLKVEALADERTTKDRIGENREKSDKGALPVTTDSDVAAFVTQALRDELKRSGFPVVDEGPTHVLRGSVQELAVNLEGTYKSSVRTRLTLTDASGAEKWTGLMSGSNTRFSMSEGPDNYLQSLGDALLEATDGLARTEGFVKGLRGGTVPAP